jgi:hypothetical protein
MSVSYDKTAVPAALIADPFAYCFAQAAKTGSMPNMPGVDPAVPAGISDENKYGSIRVLILNSLESDLNATVYTSAAGVSLVHPIAFPADPPAPGGSDPIDSDVIPGVRTYPSPAKHRPMQSGAAAKMGGLGVYSFVPEVTLHATFAWSLSYGTAKAGIAVRLNVWTPPRNFSMTVCADLGAKYKDLADFCAQTVDTGDTTYFARHASDVANSVSIHASWCVGGSLMVWIHDAKSTLGMAPE